MENLLQKETDILVVLKTIFDPEIPVNIYDLGLIYEVKVEGKKASVTMTLTAPNCPMAEDLVAEVKQKVLLVDGIDELDFKLVFDPPWDRDMISEEAKLELGLL